MVLMRPLFAWKPLALLARSLKTYALHSPLCRSMLADPQLAKLAQIFKKYDFELRIAGGAVRDLVMDIRPHDVDLATNATPQRMIDMFNSESVRLFNLNGVRHGTVCVRIDDRVNFEITTLRIDVKTYGRHADVEFTNDWHLDALRRDLTVNSLFLGTHICVNIRMPCKAYLISMMLLPLN